MNHFLPDTDHAELVDNLVNAFTRAAHGDGDLRGKVIEALAVAGVLPEAWVEAWDKADAEVELLHRITGTALPEITVENMPEITVENMPEISDTALPGRALDLANQQRVATAKAISEKMC
ncbi:hypothetical protein [Paracoccus versutus]|uniref:Uncharacterized protein n=1 Tax=Paracoccus versutus TaxID=34007 RepID=A0A3D9XIN0_PARVE|nr:hypothetical protein [Paracoccus versutus]REF70255.1 hypothetical protein BDD41_2981 [Paracoccus versutus]WGR57427.1 hypothetical protein E3U25_15655 [Paracoccus versutus]